MNFSFISVKAHYKSCLGKRTSTEALKRSGGDIREWLAKRPKPIPETPSTETPSGATAQTGLVTTPSHSEVVDILDDKS